jgi:hypothetical protein
MTAISYITQGLNYSIGVGSQRIYYEEALPHGNTTNYRAKLLSINLRGSDLHNHTDNADVIPPSVLLEMQAVGLRLLADREQLIKYDLHQRSIEYYRIHANYVEYANIITNARSQPCVAYDSYHTSLEGLKWVFTLPYYYKKSLESRRKSGIFRLSQERNLDFTFRIENKKFNLSDFNKLRP